MNNRLIEVKFLDGPDYLVEYPPDEIEPGKHFKQDKSNPPSLEGPGNLGKERDWEIPERFIDDENVFQFRSFRTILQPEYANLEEFQFAVLVMSAPGFFCTLYRLSYLNGRNDT